MGELIGRPYDRSTEQAVSYRVLADHARAVAFLLADGVFPSSEGRGYVLRRILRRAVRHAWLLGRREPTLVDVVDAVVETMGGTYPDLVARRDHLLTATRSEEERFLSTIEGGMARFEELASGEGGTIPGEEAFKLYDTFGFPLDLTELMAAERGYTVDVQSFFEALEEQRSRSRADRAASRVGLEAWEGEEGWTAPSEAEQTFVGYDALSTRTEVLSYKEEDGEVGLVLRENPFYVESGGQVSDVGEVRGDGWTLQVTRVAKVGGRTAVFGPVSGSFPAEPGAPFMVDAEVDAPVRRDTVRNHTATHLLHAALRSVLGTHVVQRGSLVAPDRLRFDFAHTAPMTAEERGRVERIVNEEIWASHPVEIAQRAYEDAVAAGAMALFGEKYGDEVRVVSIPGVSMELCGGTHASNTGEIGLFRLVGRVGRRGRCAACRGVHRQGGVRVPRRQGGGARGGRGRAEDRARQPGPPRRAASRREGGARVAPRGAEVGRWRRRGRRGLGDAGSRGRRHGALPGLAPAGPGSRRRPQSGGTRSWREESRGSPSSRPRCRATSRPCSRS